VLAKSGNLVRILVRSSAESIMIGLIT